MEQWIALAVVAILLIGGAVLMFRDPPRKDQNSRDDERFAGPNGGTGTDG